MGSALQGRIKSSLSLWITRAKRSLLNLGAAWGSEVQSCSGNSITNLGIRRRNTPSFIYTANENNHKDTNHQGAKWALQFISASHHELKTSWFLRWVPQAIVFIYISPWSEVRADHCYLRPWLFFPDSYNYYSPGDSFSQSGHPLT